MHKTDYPEQTDAILKKYGLDRSQVNPVVFRKGETVLEEGYPMSALYFVVSGTCRIQTYSPDGKIISFGTAGSGSAIGEMELLLGQAESCNTVLVLTEMTCLALPLAAARNLIRTNASLSYQLGHNAAMIWWYRNNNYISALSADAMTRLCLYLLQNEERGKVSVPLTEISNAISTSYRHLLRLLQSLIDDGALTKEGKTYIILDRKRITRETQFR